MKEVYAVIGHNFQGTLRVFSIVEGWPLGLKWDLPFWGMFKQTQNPWHPTTYIDKSWSHVPVMVLRRSRTDRKNMYYRGNLWDWLAGCMLGKQTMTGYSYRGWELPPGVMLNASTVYSGARGLDYPGKVLVLSSLAEGNTDGRHSSRREGEQRELCFCPGFFCVWATVAHRGRGSFSQKIPHRLPQRKVSLITSESNKRTAEFNQWTIR